MAFFDKFFEKFRNKLLVLIVTGTLVPVVFVGSYSVISSKDALVNIVEKQLRLEGESSAKTIKAFLDNIKSDILYLSEVPPVQGIIRARDNNGIDPEDGSTYQAWVTRLNSIFRSFVQNRQYYYQIRYLDENGNELVRLNNKNNRLYVVPKNELQNKSSSSYFQEILQLNKGDIYISDINLNRENGQIEDPHVPVIRYGIPVYSENGLKKGIIIANILVDEIFEVARNEQLEQQDNQEFFIINKDGYYLHNPDEEKQWGFEFNKNETIQNDYKNTIASEILSNSNGFISKGSKFLISYETISPQADNQVNPFILLYQTPKNKVLAPINNFTIVAIIVTIIAGVFFVWVGTTILKNVIQSMTEITGVLSSFSSEVVTTVDEQERITMEQSSSVQETTTTMEELNVSSQQSAQRSEFAAKGAQEALNSVNKGNEAVDKTVKEMENVNLKVQKIAEQITNLSNTTNQISSISDLVSELANQTNMLALNAAVEAVRAGEHGKGFGVVASEIRKLSDQSEESGKKISDLVEQIKNAIKSTVHVTEEGKDSVEKSVAMAYNTANVFNDIFKVMEDIVQSNQQIALNSKQQATATEQVAETMNQLKNAADETVKGISQMKSGTEQLNKATSTLKTVI